MNKKLKVLVIDDSATARISIKRILNQFTDDIILAENGVQGIASAYNEQPDLIFLDLFMPIWNGLMALTILKNSDKTKHIPIIMLSGQEKAGDRIRAKKLGALSFIQKPCSEETIKIIIDDFTNEVLYG